MYIADTGNKRVRKVTVSTGIITTIAGGGGNSTYCGDNGIATSACLYYPTGIALDLSGEKNNPNNYFIFGLIYLFSGNVYIADTLNNRIRKVTVSTDIITTVAGTGGTSFSGDGGAATSATLWSPYGIAVDSSGRTTNLFSPD